MVKFMYLRDPAFRKNRTMTIARKKLSDTEVEIAYCINLIGKDSYAYAQAGYVPDENVHDSFNKKRGRQIAAARLEKGHSFRVSRTDGGDFKEAILQFLANESPNYYAKKIGKHYLKIRALVDLAHPQ